ncbi:MAG TPA: hypothetical protein VFO55_09490 [Gemmatimonadaceae bacterium]|nr:hypothetical protein [Gemmatimonadaceae bacterium]
MKVDPESIARVLDGRATAGERARVLAQADDSPELLALLADSAAAMNEAESATAGVVAIDSRRGRRVPRSAWMAIAAVLVIGVAIPAVWSGRDNLGVPPANIEGSPGLLAAARSGAQLSGTRGAASAARAEQSVRLGARVTDYSVLANSRDTAALSVAIEIAAVLRSIPGGGAAASEFDRLSSGARPEPLGVRTLAAVEQVTDARLFRMAGWLELIRVAVADRSTGLLALPEMQSALERMARDRSVTAETRLAVEQIGRAIESSPPDWAVLDRVPGEVLTVIAR